MSVHAGVDDLTTTQLGFGAGEGQVLGYPATRSGDPGGHFACNSHSCCTDVDRLPLTMYNGNPGSVALGQIEVFVHASAFGQIEVLVHASAFGQIEVLVHANVWPN